MMNSSAWSQWRAMKEIRRSNHFKQQLQDWNEEVSSSLYLFPLFSPSCWLLDGGLISKLMVDILMGGNTQMYYLNGGIDYNEIVTSRSSPLAPTSEHASFLTPTHNTNITFWINYMRKGRFSFHIPSLRFLFSFLIFWHVPSFDSDSPIRHSTSLETTNVTNDEHFPLNIPPCTPTNSNLTTPSHRQLSDCHDWHIWHKPSLLASKASSNTCSLYFVLTSSFILHFHLCFWNCPS